MGDKLCSTITEFDSVKVKYSMNQKGCWLGGLQSHHCIKFNDRKKGHPLLDPEKPVRSCAIGSIAN